MNEVGLHNAQEISKIYGILIEITKRIEKLEDKRREEWEECEDEINKLTKEEYLKSEDKQ